MDKPRAPLPEDRDEEVSKVMQRLFDEISRAEVPAAITALSQKLQSLLDARRLDRDKKS